MAETQHRWDEIRETQTSITTEFIRGSLDGLGHGIHESLLRSFHIVQEVKAMLERGDSPQTVLTFIKWAEQRRG